LKERIEIVKIFGMKNILSIILAWGMMNQINTSETPTFLYKILSFPHWQASLGRKVVITAAEDDAFIHFSTEEQVERIVQKYWADAPQYVVLKIDAEQLKGRLEYEANPGGFSKYYHLYDGFIPIQAIMEAKIAFRQPIASFHGSSLKITQVGDSVLRKIARSLTKEEILSDEIQDLIKDMQTAMRAAPGVGLAAPQIGKSIQLAVVEDMEHSHLTPEQLALRDRHKVPFQVIINPILTIVDAETASFFEGCLSIPTFLGLVPRAKAVRVECLNECGEPVVIHAKGWHARILQHEIDHLNGTLYIDKAVKETLMTEENYHKLWKNMPIQEICNCLIHKNLSY
jgi:peptide deformylase